MELERKRERGDSSMELERKRERVEFFLEPERERIYEPLMSLRRKRRP
jgi:hypothetical protein